MAAIAMVAMSKRLSSLFMMRSLQIERISAWGGLGYTGVPLRRTSLIDGCVEKGLRVRPVTRRDLVRLQPASNRVRGVLWSRVECNGRTGRGLMDCVNDGLEHRLLGGRRIPAPITTQS